MLVKKYGNRRLYDTDTSRYVTLDEIAERVHHGEDIRVVDAKTGHDLTQTVLAQIILESRGAAKLLPVPLLKQLVRMRDDALADFFGRYVTWALEVYLRLRSGTRSMLPFDPFAGLSMAPPVLSRFFGGGGSNSGNERPASDAPPPPMPTPVPPPDPDAAHASVEPELAALRRELDELKAAVKGKKRAKKRKKVKKAQPKPEAE
ncbi:MAG: hypothetical protein KC486_08415 [Myxococcales bacterium]|nr:hypothetical protein [Myxococcales bacterium]